MDDFEKRWQRIQSLIGAEARGDAPVVATSKRTLFGIPSHVEQVMERVAAEDEARCASRMMRERMRQEGIAAREALGPDVRAFLSNPICERLVRTEAFAGAQTILAYRAIRAEVCLDAVIEAAQRDGKLVAFPVCLDERRMIAVADEGAWTRGRFGIPEPRSDGSRALDPTDIDLVICPATAFDAAGNRLGMGAGYYDRFLPACAKATRVLVAFEAQRFESIPCASWETPLDAAITESAIYPQGTLL